MAKPFISDAVLDISTTNRSGTDAWNTNEGRRNWKVKVTARHHLSRGHDSERPRKDALI